MSRVSINHSSEVNAVFATIAYVKAMIRSHSVRLLVRLFLALLMALGIAAPAYANITFTLTTGQSTTRTQSLVKDSNKCPAQGPTSAYVGGILRNTSGAAVSNVVATMSGLNTNIYFAGSQPASQFIGTLGAGESIAVYWFVGYSCNNGAVATPTISTTSSSGTRSTSLTLTIRNAISANAGGQVISSTLGPGAVVGQTIFFDARYDFGGTDTGDEYFLQPSGGQNFNANCFRLVDSEITGSNVNAAPVGSRNQLYFRQPNKQPGNGYFINVRYYFEYLCAGASTSARPYAVQTSGNTNIKYTGNFDGTGSISISFPPATNPFTITKSVNQTSGTVGAPGNLTYTVTITNPSAYDAIMSELVDVLPTGMTFAGVTASSGVTVSNSSSLPSTGASGTLRFVGRRGQSYRIPAGGSFSLVYEATRPASSGEYTNSAQGIFGQATTPVAQSTFTLFNPTDNPPVLPCPVGETLFDWDGVNWPGGSLNNSYQLGDFGTIGFDIVTNGNFAARASFGGAVPSLTTAVSGGLNPLELALAFNKNNDTRDQQAVTTITLPREFTGVQFSVFDIDRSSTFQDRITVYGLLNGTRVEAILSSGPANTVQGDSLIGSVGASDTTADGTGVVTFLDPVDTIIIEYGNGSAAPNNPSNQSIAIHDISFCTPQIPELMVAKISSIIADPVNGAGPNAKAIPGATVEYLITVSNVGNGDADFVTVWDDGPADAKMCLIERNGGPVIFDDPGSNSNLTYDFSSLSAPADDLEFSSDEGASFTYIPVADADGCDSAITDFRVRPGGTFAAGGNFTVTVRFRIE